jgi:uncharacterized protein
MGRRLSRIRSIIEKRFRTTRKGEISLSHGPAIYYAVIRERGENWNASLPMRQQKGWEKHAAFMDALADDGFVVLGGPLGDGEVKFLHIVAAESEQAIEARLADDPWTPLQLLRTASASTLMGRPLTMSESEVASISPGKRP